MTSSGGICGRRLAPRNRSVSDRIGEEATEMLVFVILNFRDYYCSFIIHLLFIVRLISYYFFIIAFSLYSSLIVTIYLFLMGDMLIVLCHKIVFQRRKNISQGVRRERKKIRDKNLKV